MTVPKVISRSESSVAAAPGLISTKSSVSMYAQQKGISSPILAASPPKYATRIALSAASSPRFSFTAPDLHFRLLDHACTFKLYQQSSTSVDLTKTPDKQPLDSSAETPSCASVGVHRKSRHRMTRKRNLCTSMAQ